MDGIKEALRGARDGHAKASKAKTGRQHVVAVSGAEARDRHHDHEAQRPTDEIDYNIGRP